MQDVTSNHVQDVTSTGTYSVAEAARLLGVSPNTVRARCKSGALRCERALRPQGEVIRVYLDVQDVQQVQGAARADSGAGHVQAGTSTGTYNDTQLELARAEQLAIALRPLVEAVVAPLRAELADVRAQLGARDQELGSVRLERDQLAAQASLTDSERQALEVLRAEHELHSRRWDQPSAEPQRSWWRWLWPGR